MRRRHEDVVDDKVMASGAAHADHRPGVYDGGSVSRYQQMPNLRRTGRSQPWAILIHDCTGTEQPTGMIDAAGEIPAAPDAIAAVDSIRLAFRPQGPRNADVRGLAKELASDLRLQPPDKEGGGRGDHRTPADGAIDPGEFFNGTEGRQWWQLRPPMERGK